MDGLLPLCQYLGGSPDRAVFRTEYHLANSRRAAVKLVLAGGRNAAMLLDRWRAAEAVSHPRLVRLFGCGSGTLRGVEFVYVVMEHAEEDLASVLETRCLTATEARDILGPTLDVLAYLHSEGFVHGHLSPANVLAVDDQLKLASDSVCRWEGECARLRDCDQWDAPETARGGVSPAADMWALGAVLTAALTQRPVCSSALAEPFQEIVSHCMKENPGDRWTAGQILAYLAAPIPAGARSAKRPSSMTWIAIVLAALLVFVAAVTWLRHGAHQTAPPIAVNAVRPNPVQPNPVRPQRPRASRATAAALRQVLPEIPGKARDTIHGTVRINVRVDVEESGSVADASIVPPEGSRYLANLTLDAARRWHFPPGNRQQWLLHFQLQQAGTKVSTERLK